MALPLVSCILLLALWVTPLTLQIQKRLFYTAEIVCAWSAMEVFLVALVGSLLEISQFAKFMVGSACDPLADVLILLIPEAPVCFDSRVSVSARVPAPKGRLLRVSPSIK